MNNETKKTALPKLRFPEFQAAGDWEIERVGELCDFIVPGRNKPKNFFGDIPWITTPDLAHNETIYKSKSGLAISLDEAKSVGTRIAPKNSIIISCVGDLGLVSIAGNEIVVNQQLHVFIAKSRIQSRFLLYSLSTKKGYMEKIATKTALLYLNKENCNSIPISFPTLAEQQKIAAALSSLDDLLTAQSAKLAALQTHKRGLMQGLFPAEGETVPKLRFPEFQDAAEWTSKYILDLAHNGFTNGVFNDPKKVGSGYKLVNVSDMYIDSFVDEKRLSLVNITTAEFLKNKVEFGDIFFTRSSLVPAGIAASNIYMGASDDVTFDGHLIMLRPNTGIVSPLFLHYLLKTENVRSQLITKGKRATMTTIGQADVATTAISFPALQEQYKIADCLSSLDNRIGAQREKIEALKLHKKGLMQNLFPAAAEPTA